MVAYNFYCETQNPSYLDSFSDIDQTTPYDWQESVKSDHLLYQDSVHALFVRGRVAPQGSISVKVRGKLRDNVSSYFIHNVICWSSSTRRCSSLQLMNSSP